MCITLLLKFSMSMTMGEIALTRVSTAAVSHVVQPRFEPPAVKKLLIWLPSRPPMNECTVSNARIAALVIGSSTTLTTASTTTSLSALRSNRDCGDPCAHQAHPLTTQGRPASRTRSS
jgi:hypothetical protein